MSEGNDSTANTEAEWAAGGRDSLPEESLSDDSRDRHRVGRRPRAGRHPFRERRLGQKTSAAWAIAAISEVGPVSPV
jgi:hypothetical protein